MSNDTELHEGGKDERIEVWAVSAEKYPPPPPVVSYARGRKTVFGTTYACNVQYVEAR